ncbi:MAG: rhamnan synthesis F family protein [Acidocella sp.]|nr:rhamnan synthesis F family protein [Acidocella sp.]
MKKYLRQLSNLIHRSLSGVKWLAIMPIALLIGQIKPRRQIISCWPTGAITLGPKVVLFMHFDRYGNVRPQLLHYMRELTRNGREVVFVTNAGKLNAKAMAALQEVCVAVIIRKNQGYDFGAWRDAIEHFALPQANTEEVILANDSVFGPLWPLDAMLAKIDYTKADIWGLTDSWQVRYHLQSFFLAFGKTALQSKAFAKFWGSVRPVPSKTYIVKTYEVGITQKMAKGGLRCSAIWPYEVLLAMVEGLDFKKLLTFKKYDFRHLDPVSVTRKVHLQRIRDGVARRSPLNPTAELWRQLLQAGFPFIKRELLRDNPTNVEDIHDWIKVVRDELGADPEPTLRDLQMMLKQQAP